MPEPVDHVLGGFRPFGSRRCRALCSCGHETRPVEGTDGQTPETAARHLLLTEHGAREPRPGESVSVPYVGGGGPASAAP